MAEFPTCEQMAKNVAEKALDEFLYHGKSIREWMKIIVDQEPKTGHWMHDGSHWKNRFICSECGYKLFDEPTNYCPYCGTRMESKDKE